MKPKEKAKELVEKFTQFASYGKMEDEDTLQDNAKECALICVDEIMKEILPMDTGLKQYYENVREEITKL